MEAEAIQADIDAGLILRIPGTSAMLFNDMLLSVYARFQIMTLEFQE
jgi:hypothetical protein